MTFYKSAEQYYSEMTSTEKEVDTSEHSLIYKSNMPISMELSYHSLLMDELEKKIYAKSALDNKYYDNLIKRCRDIGLEKTLGDYASGIVTMKGTKGAILPKGSYVATKFGKIYITFAELILDNDGEGKVLVIANEKGSSYNAKAGDICSFPVEYKGMDFVVNEEEISNGIDDETYEHLYERYDSRMKEIITPGNVPFYIDKAKEVSGVGIVIGYECMNANKIYTEGNILIVISNSNNRRASAELIEEVLNHLNNNRFIGCKINVISIEELLIDISCAIETNNDINTIIEDIKQSSIVYFEELVKNKKSVKWSKIYGIINDVDGVDDLFDLKINNNTINIPILEGYVPVLGTIDISKSEV